MKANYELIVDALTIETANIIFIKDYEGKFIYGNETLAKLYNTTPEELIGKCDSDFNLNIEQTDFYQKNIEEIMDSNKTVEVIENITNVKTNEVRYFQSIKKPFVSKEGKKCILVISNDITEIENSKKEIEEKKFRLDEALENIGEGVWDWDINSNMVSHNHKWCEMFGVDDSKLKHDLDFFASVIYEEDKKSVFDRIEFALANKSIYQSQHRMVCKDGTIKWVEDRGKIVLYDEHMNPTRMIGSVKDISDTILLKEKEHLLEQQSRLASLGEMIGNISHQWRQPLSAISTISSSVKLHGMLNSFDINYLDEAMDQISNQIEYLSKTIDDFRDFIKNDRTKRLFSIKHLLNSSLSIAKASIMNNYIKIETNIEVDAYSMGFESEILQAVINILNNAKDALKTNVINENERMIFIDTQKEADKIVIKIKDNAGGIPENIINKIFDPYFTTKLKSSGTGLGLYMCKKIIEENNNGTVEVRNSSYKFNDKLYTGAEFIIKFDIIELDYSI